MHLGPRRQPNEPLAAYRCRYARFALACSGIFGLALTCLLLIAPQVDQSGAPVLLMFLYVGLPMALGISALATIGFAIGAVSARLVARVPTAAHLMRRVRGILTVLFFTPFMLFSGHLALTGWADGKIPLFARSRHAAAVHVTPDERGWYFFSIAGFAALTCLFLWVVLLGIHGIIDPAAHEKRLRRRHLGISVNLRIIAALFACFGLRAWWLSYEVALEYASAMSRYPLLRAIIDAFGRWPTLLVLLTVGVGLLHLAYRSYRLGSNLRGLRGRRG